MTTQRDGDRIISAWVDLMPDETPDRVIESVLRASATTPQVRRSWRGLPWRIPPMLRAPIAIGAAAILVVAGAVIVMRPSSTPPVGGLPTPSISPSPATSASASPTAAQLPTAIQHRWVSDHRGIIEGEGGTTMLLDDTSVELAPANSGSSVVLTSLASSTGADAFRLVSGATDEQCATGDAGTYRWTLDASGRTLTIAADGDDCAVRADAVAGQWWLMGCKDPQNYCLGELSAGQYRSQFISPRVDVGAWVPSFGDLGFTVPDGWANASDFPESYVLMPIDSFAATPDSPPVHQVIFATRPSPLAKDATCASSPPPGVGATVGDLAGWLGTVNGLVATDPTPITIGGYSGQWLDLRVDAAADGLCVENDRPLVEYMTSQPSGVIGEERHRLILLDIGAGDVLTIAIVSTDPDSFEAFVTEAMPIVQSVDVRAAP